MSTFGHVPAFFAQRHTKRPKRILKSIFFKIHDCIWRGDRRRFLLRELPKFSVGCEIGVWKGQFSEAILSIVNPAHLILVDPWLHQPQIASKLYGDDSSLLQVDMDTIYTAVRDRLGADPRISILRKKCEDVTVEDIPDGSLDWVYIDGVHEFDFMLHDLRFSNAKIKSGGVICGDDFDSHCDYAIPRALTSFLAESPNWKLAWIKRRQFFLRKK